MGYCTVETLVLLGKNHKLHNWKSNLLCWIRSDIRLAEIMPRDFLETTKIHSLKCILMESHIIWQFQEERLRKIKWASTQENLTLLHANNRSRTASCQCLSCADREGDIGSPTPTPLGKSRHHRPTSETPFHH